MWIIHFSGLLALLSYVSSEVYDDHHKVKQVKKEAHKEKKDKHFFGGLYPGRCLRDGVYIRDAYSLVYCSNNNKYIQPCAPGTRNGPLHAYLPGVQYGATDFCNVNLVPFGGLRYMYPVLQYGGLHLPYHHNDHKQQKKGYVPHLFFPNQFYDRKPSYFHPPHRSYLPPSPGYRLVEKIKNAHLYEKPDSLLVDVYPGKEAEKDYVAIKRSFKGVTKAEPEELKIPHDDYQSSYNNFVKKSFDLYEEAPKAYAQTARKVQYKETRYEPPNPTKYDSKIHVETSKYLPSSYEKPNDEAKKYSSDKKAIPSPEVPKKIYKSIDDPNDDEFSRFFDLFDKANSDGIKDSYNVGYVEDGSKGFVPLKEEIHGPRHTTRPSGYNTKLQY